MDKPIATKVNVVSKKIVYVCPHCAANLEEHLNECNCYNCNRNLDWEKITIDLPECFTKLNLFDYVVHQRILNYANKF